MITASYVALAALALTATVDAAPFKVKIGRRFPIHADEIEARQAAATVTPSAEVKIQTAPNPTVTPGVPGVPVSSAPGAPGLPVSGAPGASGTSSSHHTRPSMLPHYNWPPGLPLCKETHGKSSGSMTASGGPRASGAAGGLHPSGASGVLGGVLGASASSSGGAAAATPLRQSPDGKPILADPIVGTTSPVAGAASSAVAPGVPSGPLPPPGGLAAGSSRASSSASSHHVRPSPRPFHPTCIPEEIALKIGYKPGSMSASGTSGLARPTSVIGVPGGAPVSSGLPGAPIPGAQGSSALPGGPVASPAVGNSSPAGARPTPPILPRAIAKDLD